MSQPERDPRVVTEWRVLKWVWITLGILLIVWGLLDWWVYGSDTTP